MKTIYFFICIEFNLRFLSFRNNFDINKLNRIGIINTIFNKFDNTVQCVNG